MSSASGPQSDADQLVTAADQAIAARGGDAQVADAEVSAITAHQLVSRTSQSASRIRNIMRRVTLQLRKLLGFLTAKGWIWKAAIAGLCGSLTHTLLMLGKAKLGILESFQPYQSLQIALGYWTGEHIHPLVPGCFRISTARVRQVLPLPISTGICRAAAVPLRGSSPVYSDG